MSLSRTGLGCILAAAAVVVVAPLGCSSHPDVPPQPSASASASTSPPALVPDNPKEPHFANLRQLTFGGENAEAYWAFTSDTLIMQARAGDQKCDRIYQLPIAAGSKPIPVSSGKGATTCSYFMPGDKEVTFASTELGSPDCPPKPDMSKGYVWALYDSYDIFKSKPDGSGMVRLTDAPGYDAEGTVCRTDGSIIFTSVRDGDIELYRMDADGKNQKRLTNTPGYDGGAFFNEDCTKIVWRASRPKEGKELDDFRGLLKQGLVRPTKLEIFVANADGTDPVQLTYLDAASFAPFFFPGSKRVFFSSNYGSNQKGPEFDIYAIDVDGKNLEKITDSPGFDSFPMFSPDGKKIAFSSNRNGAPGAHDTNVFVADWIDTPPAKGTAAADRLLDDATWLADPAREGRGVGTKGIEEAGAFIETRMKTLGLEPAGKDGSYRQPFDVVVKLSGEAKLTISGKSDETIEGPKPLSFSSAASGVEAPLVFANYGVDAPNQSDYKGLDVKGKIVVVRRYLPEGKAFEAADLARTHGDLRHKAWVAREKGAKGLIVVDYPAAPAGVKDWKMPDEGKIPGLSPDSKGDAGLPAIIVSRASFSKVVDRLLAGEKLKGKIDATLTPTSSSAFNVVGRLKARGASVKPGVIVVGAHYDHLGLGEHELVRARERVGHPSGRRRQRVRHGGDPRGRARAREARRTKPPTGTSYFVAFSGEERGLLGSSFIS
jgi:Tol biopolymer transport system component